MYRGVVKWTVNNEQEVTWKEPLVT
jgi:hypothetical protein